MLGYEHAVHDAVPTLAELLEGKVREAVGHAARRFERAEDPTPNRIRVVGVDDLSEHTVADGFTAGVETAGDDGHAAGERFEIHDAEALSPPGHHEGVGEAIVVGLLGLGDVAGEDHTVGHAEGGGFLL